MTTSLLTAAAITFLINVFTSLVKDWIYPKFGAFGVQIFVFILAIVGSLYVLYEGFYPGFKKTIEAAALIFSTAITFYEVLLKYIPWFKGNKS